MRLGTRKGKTPVLMPSKPVLIWDNPRWDSDKEFFRLETIRRNKEKLSRHYREVRYGNIK